MLHGKTSWKNELEKQVGETELGVLLRIALIGALSSSKTRQSSIIQRLLWLCRCGMQLDPVVSAVRKVFFRHASMTAKG